jgi:hypothetical protein
MKTLFANALLTVVGGMGAILLLMVVVHTLQKIAEGTGG